MKLTLLNDGGYDYGFRNTEFPIKVEAELEYDVDGLVCGATVRREELYRIGYDPDMLNSDTDRFFSLSEISYE